MIYKECPFCKREVKIAKTRKKVGKKLVCTGKYIYYCSYIDCDWSSKEFTLQRPTTNLGLISN